MLSRCIHGEGSVFKGAYDSLRMRTERFGPVANKSCELAVHFISAPRRGVCNVNRCRRPCLSMGKASLRLTREGSRTDIPFVLSDLKCKFL